MTVSETKLPGVLLVEPKVFGDSRGWFMETYSKKKTELEIGCDFVQDNQSFSAQRGTLRGIHFQFPPMAQAKLVRCTRGKLMDYAVDLRSESAAYKQWIAVELSADNKLQLFIPRGFGHAFLTLEDDTEIVYKADNYYSPEHDGTILWSDEDIGIDWVIPQPILSEKDRQAKPLRLAGIDHAFSKVNSVR